MDPPNSAVTPEEQDDHNRPLSGSCSQMDAFLDIQYEFATDSLLQKEFVVCESLNGVHMASLMALKNGHPKNVAVAKKIWDRSQFLEKTHHREDLETYKEVTMLHRTVYRPSPIGTTGFRSKFWTDSGIALLDRTLQSYLTVVPVVFIAVVNPLVNLWIELCGMVHIPCPTMKEFVGGLRASTWEKLNKSAKVKSLSKANITDVILSVLLGYSHLDELIPLDSSGNGGNLGTIFKGSVSFLVRMEKEILKLIEKTRCLPPFDVIWQAAQRDGPDEITYECSDPRRASRIRYLNYVVSFFEQGVLAKVMGLILKHDIALYTVDTWGVSIRLSDYTKLSKIYPNVEAQFSTHIGNTFPLLASTIQFECKRGDEYACEE